jgi:hypothetical protein
MLSNLSRQLTYLLAFLYAILGVVLYLFPAVLAPVFAWKVTPFMTMTIGGWCLGNAWLAWVSARRWRWALVFSTLIYLWAFGIGELLVLYNFRERLVLAHPVAWLYVFTLLINTIVAIAGIVDALRSRPALLVSGPRIPAFLLTAVLGFILFVGFLGLYGLVAPVGAPGTNGGIFPETMSPFTLRSFGMFYFSLALAVVPFLWYRSLQALLHHASASYGLIIFITLAAFLHLDLFDFTARPGGLMYFFAYLIVGIPLLFIFRKYGFGMAE